MQSIYVPIRTAQELTQRPGLVTDIMIRLQQPNTGWGICKAHWEGRLAAINPKLKMKLARDTRKDMEKKLEGIHFLSLVGGLSRWCRRRLSSCPRFRWGLRSGNGRWR